MQMVIPLFLAQKQLGTVDYYVRAQDNEGNTALHLAVQNGQIEVK